MLFIRCDRLVRLKSKKLTSYKRIILICKFTLFVVCYTIIEYIYSLEKGLDTDDGKSGNAIRTHARTHSTAQRMTALVFVRPFFSRIIIVN